MTRHSIGVSAIVSWSFDSITSDAGTEVDPRLQTVLALELRINRDCGGGRRRRKFELKSLLALKRWLNDSFSSTGDRLADVGLDTGVFEVDEEGDEAEDEEADDKKQSLPLLVLPTRVLGTRISGWWVMGRCSKASGRGQLNTSSSSSSSSEFAGTVAVTAGTGAKWPEARRLCSNSSSWPIKLRFGEMMGRASLTSL